MNLALASINCMSFQSARPIPPSTDISDVDVNEHWKQTFEDYKEQTGIDLLGSPFAAEILSRSSSEQVLKHLKQFVTFRKHGSKILGILKPTVSFVLRFLDAGAEAASVRICVQSSSKIIRLITFIESLAWW